jgi:protein-tyrosine phosphatase
MRFGQALIFPSICEDMVKPNQKIPLQILQVLSLSVILLDEVHMASAHLEFPHLHNARDLGGHPTRHGAQTRYYSLVRSDSTANLNAEGVQAVWDYGIRTVIDLRYPSELARNPSPFAAPDGLPVPMRYVHCSLLGESWEHWQARQPVYNDSNWYSGYLDVSQPELRDVMQTIARAPVGGVLFHCAAGKDRTGVVAMLLLALAEVEEATIVADYAISAEYLQESFLVYLAQISDPVQRAAALEGHRCEAPFATHTLLHLRQRYGGAEGYLRTIGLRDDDMTPLKQRLV